MKRSFFVYLITLCCFANNALNAQQYIYNYNIQAIQNGRILKFPFAGGLNNPQFSSSDINLDGKNDVYIFDRAGGKSLALINEGSTGEINYFYWQQYEARFPSMQDWTILIDYNCDGIEDIITGFDTGVKTYLASVDGANITYTEDESKLEFTEAGFFFDITVGSIDIPGFADVNMDGDIDLLTFYIVGGVVDYYENRQIEDGLPCGTWALEHINSCWGNFYESGINYAVDLNVECKGITNASAATADGMHAGSTFMIFDEDADNDMDIVLGDLAFDNLNKLTNGGDNTFSNIIAQDTTFPEYDSPYSEPIFPAAFLLDVNNDNKKDMLVSPNNVNQSETSKNVAYYKNVSGDDTYVFDFQIDSLFVNDMIDLGEGAFPSYFDYNYDGRYDLIIGNYGYFEDGSNKGKIALFENTGTNTAPEFSLITRDFAGISAFAFNNIITTFGDMDGDGDADMLLGEEDGFIHYFKNIGPPDGPASFILFGANYQGIDVGQNSAPQLIDITNDGLNDLILGEKNGNLNYYHNTGTAAAPIFTIESEFWGNVDVRTLGSLTGHAVPNLFQTTDGNYELYVGCEAGTIYLYEPTVDFSGAFVKVTDKFNNIDEGNFAGIAVKDINADNFPDIVTGNQRGGITFYRDEAAVTINAYAADNNNIKSYPNPVSDNLFISTTGNQLINAADIFTIDGILVNRLLFAPADKQILDLVNYPTALYFIRVIDINNNVIGTVKCCKF